MIPLRYREMLPPYWQEISMAEQHFGVMELEVDDRERTIDDLGDQFILQRATWALSMWEWIYFRQEKNGTLEHRREEIRRKRWAKRPFTLPTLRLIGNKYGKLLNVIEDFQVKEIRFEFAAGEKIDLAALEADFEYIRPVHILRGVPIAKTPEQPIIIRGVGYGHQVDFPICGLEIPVEVGVSGKLTNQTLTVGSSRIYHGIDGPITGFEIPIERMI